MLHLRVHLLSGLTRRWVGQRLLHHIAPHGWTQSARLYPNFDFDNVQPLLLKKAQKAWHRLPQFGHLGRVGGIHSKCGAA